MLLRSGAGTRDEGERHEEDRKSLRRQYEQRSACHRDALPAAEADASAHRVLTDAQQRSQLMTTEGFTAGYNKGKFTIQSADGSFSLSPSLQLQVRYAGTYLEGNGNDDSSYTDGFELRRAAGRLGMSYMRAWNLVRTMNAAFRDPLVVSTRGGAGRPGSGGGRSWAAGACSLPAASLWWHFWQATCRWLPPSQSWNSGLARWHVMQRRGSSST